MARTFTLVDSLALGDLQVYLQRAMRVDDGSVRLIAGSGVLAVYVPVLLPLGLLDETATVLGLRTFAVLDTEAFDAVVPVRSLLARIETQVEASNVEIGHPVTVTVPMEVNTVTWTAIAPPRGGWHPLPGIDAALLDDAAKAGIDEVAAAIPGGTGEQIVRRVRSEVWGRPLGDGLEHIPTGAGFAALSLGFLGEGDDVAVYESGPWTRLTTRRGHVLVKRRNWTIAR
jgi:hypothetical protein